LNPNKKGGKPFLFGIVAALTIELYIYCLFRLARPNKTTYIFNYRFFENLNKNI
jgi:hypothetical protein